MSYLLYIALTLKLTTMYGKKRIVINKKGQIILAGKTEGGKGGSWIPIGLSLDYNNEGKIYFRVKFLKVENKFERRLTDDNSIVKTFNTKLEIRKFIGEFYNIPK